MIRRLIILLFFSMFFLISCSSDPSDPQAPQSEASPTEAQLVETETATVTATELPTSTPEPPTLTPTEPLPTDTPTPSATATPAPPTLTPSITPTKYLYVKPTATPHFLGVQLGSPIAVANFAYPDLGCQWSGVAGQVFDIDGSPVENLVVELGGTLGGQDKLGLTLTGSAIAYGPGGYEFKLADQPIDSRGTIWVRVFDLEGMPLSPPSYFNTYANCNQNLILINFVQAYNLPDNWAYLPVIIR